MATKEEVAAEAKKINYVPLWDWCLLDPIIQGKTQGGLVVPHGTKLGDTDRSLCVKAGPGSWQNQQWIENPIKVGDVVYHLARVTPTKVVLDGHLYLAVASRDIISREERKDEQKDG